MDLVADNQKREWSYLHPETRKIAVLLSQTLEAVNYGARITSMIRPKDTIPGESGVHSTGRAIDIVPIVAGGEVYRFSVYELITEYFNRLFPRIDGHETVIWHDKGSGYHFHIQVPWSQDYTDLKGYVPAEDA